MRKVPTPARAGGQVSLDPDRGMQQSPMRTSPPPASSMEETPISKFLGMKRPALRPGGEDDNQGGEDDNQGGEEDNQGGEEDNLGGEDET